MRKAISPVILWMCFGATCSVGDVVPVWSEYRIDRAGDERDLIDSHSARMCTSDNGNTYVVWVDDRDGTPDVWFNRKIGDGDQDEGWFENAAVRVNAFPDSNVWNPDIACTDTGVYVVWEDDRDGEVESHQVYFQKSTNNGETWLTEDILLEEDPDGRSNSYTPDIIADGANVYVAWSDNINGAFDILFARSTDSGNTWQPPIRIDDGEAGEAYSAFPRLDTAFNGDTVYLVWQDFRGGGAQSSGSDIYFARSTNKGQDFQSDVRIDTGDELASNDSFIPQISADGDNVYIAWHDLRGLGQGGDDIKNDVLVRYSSDGGAAWGFTTRADAGDSAGANQSLYPQVCTVGNVGHVTWHDDRNNGFYRVYYNRVVAGATSQEVRLDTYKPETGVFDSRDTQIACDGDNVVVAWLDSAEDVNLVGYNDIVYNYSADGGITWLQANQAQNDQDPYRLDSNDGGTAFKTDLTIALDGNRLRGAWTDGRGGSTDIYFQDIIAGESASVVIFESQ